MTDYTPITGELRKYATVSWDPWSEARDRLYQMCDAIDAVHAGLERENAELKAELDRVLGEQEEAIQQALMGKGGVPATDENMAEHGWVRLPVDEDGEPINIGDVMDERLPFGGYAAPAPVDVMELSRGANGYGWMVRLDAANSALISPKLLRHHHAPTVEDVLREFALKVAGEECMTMRTGVVEEYAEKLREVMAE